MNEFSCFIGRKSGVLISIIFEIFWRKIRLSQKLYLMENLAYPSVFRRNVIMCELKTDLWVSIFLIILWNHLVILVFRVFDLRKISKRFELVLFESYIIRRIFHSRESIIKVKWVFYRSQLTTAERLRKASGVYSLDLKNLYLIQNFATDKFFAILLFLLIFMISYQNLSFATDKSFPTF